MSTRLASRRSKWKVWKGNPCNQMPSLTLAPGFEKSAPPSRDLSRRGFSQCFRFLDIAMPAAAG